MNKVLRIFCVTIILLTMTSQVVFASTSKDELGLNLPVESYVLMEGETGRILHEYNADEQLPLASITKIMTMLIAIEAVESGNLTWEEMITTSEKAKQMTGTKIFLNISERMSAYDMIKGIAVASANDASVAIAEHMSGSEEAFVKRMNERASELGMVNTQFINAHGLDEPGHYSCARDIAIMSYELIKHDKILEFTSIWMDSLRNGEFELVNTNRLLRFYDGTNGLKTGSTDDAGYCISAAAKRNEMQLIAVIMKAESTTDRFESAKILLDYGFANYTVINEKASSTPVGELKVLKGELSTVTAEMDSDFNVVLPKGQQDKLRKDISMETEFNAPLNRGDKVGEIKYWINDEILGSYNIIASETSLRVSLASMFKIVLEKWICM